MKKNKKLKTRLTIEKQLEQLYLSNTHQGERYEVLWHAWCNNKRWLVQLLQTTLSSFPSYSKHDESHASTVMINIEMILGDKRIRELSASDCFMLLHTVYIHDIGMVITHTDREQIVKNDKFLDMVDQLGQENDFVFQKAVKALKQTEYDYTDLENREEKLKRLYTDKLKVYYALLHLIANYRRTEHSDFSEDRLTKWTLESDKLGSGFSMAGIPQRFFLHIAKCAGLHTQSFDKIMELPQEDNGYVGDYVHPRFVAVLLQIGDILDMDNDRFHPLTRECIGILPELSERHFEKHQSIRQLYIRPDIISIAADCQSQEGLRLVRKECDMLKSILQEAGYNWMLICPRKFSGALPTISSVKLSLNGVQIPEELVTTQFHISQKKAFSILEGSNVYKDRFVFLREFLQNAIDASKMQYWRDYVRTKAYSVDINMLKNMGPDEMNMCLSTETFPIEIEMEVIKRDEDHKEYKITSEDKENENKNWEYGVKVKIRDFGTGIDKQSILDIAKVGNSRKRERYIIQEMPEWLKPTAEFGIGLQSAFILTDTFKCTTYLRSNEKYEITFSSVKSTYYEGYINVNPIQINDQSENEKREVYGTCFEIFVPEKKKMSHELYPLAWNRKDYFDEDYESSRSLRHAAELLTQMALYVDSQMGEQLFPVKLKIVENENVDILLNETSKNRLQNLNCDFNKMKEKEKQLLVESKSFFPENSDQIQKFFEKREWWDSGLSWILYQEKLEKRKYEPDLELKYTDILIEKTENIVAMLDCRDGCFYVWEKSLCVLCTINMKNFLQMEQRKKERSDNQCEKINSGVAIYYKGILLEQIELPDLGNEMIERIDINGKMSRECLNLSRRGFTEKGRDEFYEKTYPKLIQSIHEILQVLNNHQAEKLYNTIKDVLDNRKKLLDMISHYEIDDNKNFNEMVKHYIYYPSKVDFEKKILNRFKENIISLVMLAFFAQKESYIPQIPRSYSAKSQEGWKKLIKMICRYADDIQKRAGKESILFHIEAFPTVSLMEHERIINSGNISKIINFSDIFSNENQYMIVSRRENEYAPWKQFLVSIWSEKDKKEVISFIDKYKEYLALGDGQQKEALYQTLQEMGKAALEIGMECGKNMVGENIQNSPDSYSQQYFLKWMAKYVPTIAMFASKDGNTRINIIHGQVFPYIFVNTHYKELVVKRVMEYAQRYNMQRFSIPSWQNTDMLNCERLPYVQYFVKRGYASGDSYKKVIFPFDGEALIHIQNALCSDNAIKRQEKLQKLFDLYDIRKWMKKLSEDDGKILEHYINEIGDLEKHEIREVYHSFQMHWKKGNIGTERTLNNVVHWYRYFVVEALTNAYKQNRIVAIENFKVVKEYLEKGIVYALIDVLMKAHYNESPSVLKKISQDEGNMIASCWHYILKRDYIKEFSQILEYKEWYLDNLEMEHSNIYKKNRRIVEYIAKVKGTAIKEDYLFQYWKTNIEDLLEVFTAIELGEYYEPDELIREVRYFRETLKE